MGKEIIASFEAPLTQTFSNTDTVEANSSSALSAQIRLGDAHYVDGIGALDRSLPNARDVSNALAYQPENTPNQANLSNMFWAWGQFIDHDIDLTPGGATEFVPIIVGPGDPIFGPGTIIPFTRAETLEGSGIDTPREYGNAITSILDGSMVYGSTAEETATLRSGAYLLMDGKEMLRTDGGVLAGDARAAENVVLTSLHTVFARNHNTWVEELRAADPGLDDDALFEAARLRVEAEIQAITFNEWLPILLGEAAFADYAGYNASVDTAVSLEFSAAAFRFGHTLLSSNIERITEDGSDTVDGPLLLREAFFNPDALTQGGGVDPVLRGVAASAAQELDTRVVEDVRSFLVGEDGTTGLDLAALNIMRGRDLGLQPYNDMREALGLPRAEDFGDITSDPELAAQLASVYGTVNRVDAWVGGLAEDPVSGGLLGALFSTIVIDQFSRLRDGDATWSEGGIGLDPSVQVDLWDTTLADVIQRTTEIEALQADIFFAHDRTGGTEADNTLTGDAERNLLTGGDGRDFLFGRGGDDALFGGAGDDMLFGGAGDDELEGGAGADVFRLSRVSGADTISDLEAGDIIEVDIGAPHGTMDAWFSTTGTMTTVTLGYDIVFYVSGGDAEMISDALVFV